MRFCFLIGMFLSFAYGLRAEVLLDLPFNKAEDLKNFTQTGNAAIVADEGGGMALEVVNDLPMTAKWVSIALKPQSLAMRRVTISCEIKKEIGVPSQKYQGGKILLSSKTSNQTLWNGLGVGHGNSGWTSYCQTVDLPQDLSQVDLHFGIQQASGKIRFRNFKLETDDNVYVPLSSKVNMGFADDTAKDGKGGWTDQGPENDARNFNFKEQVFAGIPFSVISPNGNHGQSVLSFKSQYLPSGLTEAVIDFGATPVSGKYLYLLHAATGGTPPGQALGFIDIVSVDGEKHSLPVLADRDISNWWMVSSKENAVPAAIWKNGSGTVGMQASRFSLDEISVPIKSVTFRAGGSPAAWLVVAATISNRLYSAENKTVTIHADKRWKALSGQSTTAIIADSAIDLSWLNKAEEAGSAGRLAVTPAGDFYFERNPEQKVRFNGNVQMIMFLLNDDFSTKEKIEEFAEQNKRAGYNMVRLHFLAEGLMRGSSQEYKFNPEYLDKLDYYVYALKKRGIYLCFDVMCGRYGFSPEGQNRQYNFKRDLHFLPELKQHWITGMKALIQRVNPYTKMSIAEDPAFVFTVGFNEQEFGLTLAGSYPMALDGWREFLRRRYVDIPGLKKAWGEKAATINSFEDIPAFSHTDIKNTDTLGQDIARYLTDVEEKTYDFYRSQLREAGFKGPIANYNMGQTLRYNIVRDRNDYVAINAYHAHPFGQSIDINSSIAAGAQIICGFSAARRYHRPLVVTEHGHGFWNKYRYEQGMIMGGYAAFQNFNALISHSHSVMRKENAMGIRSLWTYSDPITRASEFLTAILFLRRDASPAANTVRILLDPESIFASASSNDAINVEERRLALVTGLSVERKVPGLKPHDNEVFLPAFGGSPVLMTQLAAGGFALALDHSNDSFSFDQEIALLKAENQLPKNNRSSYRNQIFESSSGELYLEGRRNFMSLNTPRAQGICGEAGTFAQLRDLEIIRMSTRGCVAAVSVDGLEPLSNAKRIVLVYITNAMNSGMVFTDETWQQVIDLGKAPVLLETGTLEVKLRNSHAAQMTCYALDLNGARKDVIPLKVENGHIELRVDSGALKGGPAVFFELTL